MNLLALAGLFVLVYRVSRWSRSLGDLSPTAGELESLSLIIPARNEEANLPALLQSLSEAARGLAHFEVIVVDDQSTDRTAEIAQAHGARVIATSPRPEGWSGKNWACWTGAQVTSHQLLLFTDADTVHRPQSLLSAARALRAQDAQMLSCLPYHLSKSLWEKALGVFQVLLLIATAALQKPTAKKQFAIGQYLLFTREFYQKIGGHESIRNLLADDLALARLTMARGGRFHLVTRFRLFDVRMYPDFKSFVAGWRRNLRLGMRETPPLAFIEITLIIASLFAFCDGSASGFLISLLALTEFARVQRKSGQFPMWATFCFPFSVLVFSWISLQAAIDFCLQRQISWRGREY